MHKLKNILREPIIHSSVSQIQPEVIISVISVILQDRSVTSDRGDSDAFCKDMFPLTLEPLWFLQMSITGVAEGHCCL